MKATLAWLETKGYAEKGKGPSGRGERAADVWRPTPKGRELVQGADIGGPDDLAPDDRGAP